MRLATVLLVLSFSGTAFGHSVDDAVANRYQQVIQKSQNNTLRSSDLRELAIAVDLRNRSASERQIDQQFEAVLRSRHTEDVRIDDFLAKGGVKALWRAEMTMLLEATHRYALLEPKFNFAQWDGGGYSGGDPINEFNYDGFYGYPTPSNPQAMCDTIDFLTGWTTIVCSFSAGAVDFSVNPFCYAMAAGLIAGPVCHIVANGSGTNTGGTYRK